MPYYYDNDDYHDKDHALISTCKNEPTVSNLLIKGYKFQLYFVHMKHEATRQKGVFRGKKK